MLINSGRNSTQVADEVDGIPRLQRGRLSILDGKEKSVSQGNCGVAGGKSRTGWCGVGGAASHDIS